MCGGGCGRGRWWWEVMRGWRKPKPKEQKKKKKHYFETQNFLFKPVIFKSKCVVELLAELSTYGTAKVPTEIKLLASNNHLVSSFTCTFLQNIVKERKILCIPTF